MAVRAGWSRRRSSFSLLFEVPARLCKWPQVYYCGELSAQRERERMVGGDLFYLTGSPSLGGEIGLCSCDWRELKAAFGCWK